MFSFEEDEVEEFFDIFADFIRSNSNLEIISFKYKGYSMFSFAVNLIHVCSEEMIPPPEKFLQSLQACQIMFVVPPSIRFAHQA